MIKIWFNEKGFCIDAPGGASSYLYDLPEDVIGDATALYTFRWVVLNHALNDLEFLCDNPNDEDLTFYSDSRLIEELSGAIEPDNNFAKSSYQYFLLKDSTKFRRITCEKCSGSYIDNRLGVNDQSYEPKA